MEELKKTEAAETAAPEVKKTTRKRTAAKKTAADTNKAETAEKTAAKKTTTRKTAAKKTADEKTAEKKTAAKTTAAKKTAAKKAEPVSPFITEMDQYLFGMGTHYEIYKKMGAHPTVKDGVAGVHFAVWAPNAEYVSILGNFNGWDSSATPMTRLEPMGIWETFVPGLQNGEIYKYYLHTKNGWDLEKSDPYASYAELRPGTASRVADTESFKWSDKTWMNKRESFDVDSQPVSIYEVHPGSWKCHPLQDGQAEYERFYNYRELAHALADYVKDMGYTHVELIGLSEHPLDASWGYQVTGYFAPTSRYGTPEDFMYFVDYLHKNKIGVIVDWVPAHFPKDGYGLAEFDGTCLYEHQNPMQGEHPQWGTKIFNYGRNEVKNFLIGSALNWVEHYHVDGLRVDAVASMLYLDFGRNAGEWIPNQYGGRENLEAIEFIKHLNSIVTNRNKGVMMIAEESTAWPKVTGAPEDDGLGFTLKWNMGWMNDALSYAETDPLFRKGNHNKVTFSMMYAFSEYYVLPISHDEVVHGKKSLLDRFPGLYGQKFDGMRAFLIYMFCHPGKKLLFMGSENGQFAEWNYEKEVEWFMLENEQHAKLHAFVRDLNRLYLKHSELWELDDTWDGFEWVEVNNADESILALRRKNKKGESLLALINFTPVERENHLVPVPPKASYSVLLDSMDEKYGGYKKTTHSTRAKKNADGTYTIRVNLPAHGAIIFKEKTK